MATRRRRFDIALLTLPAIAMGAGFLPSRPTKRALGFAYTDPTPLTAYTSHVIHLDAGHLGGNLIAYGLLAGTFYALCHSATHKPFWRTFTSAYLLAFPPTLAALNLALRREAISVGFSGMNTALLGALPVGLALLLADRTDFPLRDAPALFVPGLWAIVLAGLPQTRWTTLAIAGVVVLTLLYGGALWRHRPRPVRVRLTGLLRDRTLGNASAVVLVVLLVYPLVVFSAGVDADGAVPNHYVHLLGYALGFLVAFSAAVLLES